MFKLVSACPFDASLSPGWRVAGATLAGLAVLGVEAWLRVPVRPLLDGWLHDAAARVAAFVRKLTF